MISETVKYPEEAKQKGISGRVYVSFILSKKGEVTNVKIARGIDLLLDKEALRVVKSFPKWSKPAYRKLKPVRVSYTVPIIFE